MKIPPVKGMRDFYPPEMSVRNYIMGHWKAVSQRNGFLEYDGPILEYLQLYTLKSGQEIVEQLFSLTDRGGRELAIRPEMTPTLARMVCQRINSLPRPIKWFSVPRLCRAERPQKGRLREFFQWNIDIIGVEDVVADAEIIFCTLDFLQAVGLTAKDIVVRISSRKLLSEALIEIGVPAERLDPVFAILDKRSRLPQEAFEQILSDQIPDQSIRSQVQTLMAISTLDEVALLARSEGACKAIAELRRLFEILHRMGVGQFCRFDIGIVRGLAYYTGIVFEVFDADDQLRAIAGGGRYDNLLAMFDGPNLPATGMGMGDCVLEILLRDKGLIDLQRIQQGLEYYVAYTEPGLMDHAIGLAAWLRRAGRSAGFCYRPVALGKQLKQASDQGCRYCIIIDRQVEAGQVILKDMSTGDQRSVTLDERLRQPG
jgi:histidyl-tRNA synthetase